MAVLHGFWRTRYVQVRALLQLIVIIWVSVDAEHLTVLMCLAYDLYQSEICAIKREITTTRTAPQFIVTAAKPGG